MLDGLISKKFRDDVYNRRGFNQLPDWTIRIDISCIDNTPDNIELINKCIKKYEKKNGCFHFAFDPDDDWCIFLFKKKISFTLLSGLSFVPYTLCKATESDDEVIVDEE